MVFNATVKNVSVMSYIEEEQTTQRPKEKVQKDKQRSTKHTYKTKDRVTWTQVKTGGKLRCSARVSSSCSTGGTRRVNLVTNPVISHEWGKEREVFTTNGTYPWSLSKNFISIRHGVSLSSADRRNDVEKNPGKYANYFIFLNASIKYKLELYNHKQTLLHSNT